MLPTLNVADSKKPRISSIDLRGLVIGVNVLCSGEILTNQGSQRKAPNRLGKEAI